MKFATYKINVDYFCINLLYKSMNIYELIDYIQLYVL